MPLRKGRVHLTGTSNRCYKPNSPLDFDATMRSNAKREFEYKMTDQVPIIRGGRGNHDFSQSLPGFFFRFPGQSKKNSSTFPSMTISKTETESGDVAAEIPIIRAPEQRYLPEQIREESETQGIFDDQKKVEPVKRWKARHWWEAPPFLRHPLKKEIGETWNAYDSLKPESEFKGQDYLMRALRHPDGEEDDDAFEEIPEKEEHFHRRNKVDRQGQAHCNDFGIRPVYLPEFARSLNLDTVSLKRISKLQSVLRQRYGGRPTLLKTFMNYSLSKPGYIFPHDLMAVFGKMGIEIGVNECQHMVAAVDRDNKGAMSFEEFADFVYSENIVGGGTKEAQERQLRAVTRNLADVLVSRSPQLGTAFCNIDPERNYFISKSQFANAVSTAVNHVTPQSIDFLWASQFPTEDLTKESDQVNNGKIDWRSFMQQLATFASEYRMPTPCTLQGRKTQYDTLQRTVPITNGILPPVDLNRPDQDPENEVLIVADKLTHKEKNLSSMPSDAAFLTESYKDYIHTKANRAQRALSELIPSDKMKEIIKDGMTRTECIEAIMNSLDSWQQHHCRPHLDLSIEALTGGPNPSHYVNDIPAYLRIERADVQALLGCERVNNADQIDPDEVHYHIYHAKLPLEEVNDGLNRALRNRLPPRQRPKGDDTPVYGNHWQARYVMETIHESLEKADVANGGRLKSYTIFKRLDMDGDGFVTISDIQDAMQKYRIPLNEADVHAFLTEMDPTDSGAIDLSSFTRHFGVFHGSFMDSLQKTVKGVYRGGGIEYGGPLHDRLRDQLAEAEKVEKEEAEKLEADKAVTDEGSKHSQTERSQSEQSGYSISSSYRDRNPYRTSDVIKRRTDKWKPQKFELMHTLPPSRYSRTIFTDTRHLTQPVGYPMDASFLSDSDRFKTTYLTANSGAPPDLTTPQVADKIKKNAIVEFRSERVRQRQNEFAMRLQVSEACARDFEERRIARTALNKLNYERRVRMSCI